MFHLYNKTKSGIKRDRVLFFKSASPNLPGLYVADHWNAHCRLAIEFKRKIIVDEETVWRQASFNFYITRASCTDFFYYS